MTTTSQRPGFFRALLRWIGFGRQDYPVIPPDLRVPAREPLPYRVRDNFLSAAELSFYHVLCSVVGERAMVCPKVRLADVFFAARSDRYMSYFARIAQKHLDFLLCDPQTMRPLVGIELDDASHDRPDRQERDAFVDSVFATAGLPLVHIRAQRTYVASELAQRITPFLTDGAAPPLFTLPASAGAWWDTRLVPGVPFCPTCGIQMVVRTAKRGNNYGEQFYGCTNYPNCREMLQMQ